MSFDSGAISYARFRVRGGPAAPSEQVLEDLRANVANTPALGRAPEIQAGWVAGRHVLDVDLDADSVVFGEQLLLPPLEEELACYFLASPTMR